MSLVIRAQLEGRGGGGVEGIMCGGTRAHFGVLGR